MKDLFQGIVGAGKSNMCRVGWQAGDPGRVGVATSVQSAWRQNSLFLGRLVYFLLSPSTA